MRKIKIGLIACGESFGAEITVPASYFNPDGSLNRTKLINRLEGNLRVVILEKQ